MYIARLLYPVKVLGPGRRIGIWMSGCGHRCAGCSNPELWDQQDKYRISFEDLTKLLSSVCDCYQVDGFTVTGGDPFYQPEALGRLLPYINEISADVLVYTGYEYEVIKNRYSHLLSYMSVLIDGKYMEEQNHGSVLKGSDNQRIIFLKNGYRQLYLKYLEQKKSSIQNFATAGGIISVGIHLPGYKKELENIITRKKGLEKEGYG